MAALLDRIGVLLDAAGAGSYSTTVVLDPGDIQIHLGGQPEAPGTSVCITTYPGGPEPDTRNGWEEPRLQVRVRAPDVLTALDIERTTYEALHFTTGGHAPRDIGGGWFLQDCYALQSEAEPLGQDAQGQYEYARNYQLSAERS